MCERWWHSRKYAGPCYVNQANLMILDFVGIVFLLWQYIVGHFFFSCWQQVFSIYATTLSILPSFQERFKFQNISCSWLKLWKSMQVSLIEIIKLQESLEHTNEPDIYVYIYIDASTEVGTFWNVRFSLVRFVCFFFFYFFFSFSVR